MRLTAVLALSLFALAPAHAGSVLLWNFSYGNGTETGTFETNGTFADTAGPFDFVIDLSTFHVTSSAFAPGMVGLSYYAGGQPDVGFLWSGSTATQFYRGSGVYTNGSNVYSTDNNFWILFFTNITGSVAKVQGEVAEGSSDITRLTLTPVEPSSDVPEPSTWAIAGLGLVGVAGLRLRRSPCAARLPRR